MNSPIVEIDLADWRQASSRPEWTAAVEAGQVLYFPRLAFEVQEGERALLREDMLKAGTRNVSLGADGVLKGAGGIGLGALVYFAVLWVSGMRYRDLRTATT